MYAFSFNLRPSITAEQSLMELRADASKTEWAASELKSSLQLEEMKVKEASAQQFATAAQLMEVETSLAATRRELEESRRAAQRYAGDLDATMNQLDDAQQTAENSMSDLEIAKERLGHLKAGPGGYCLLRHRVQFDSKDEGSTCV
jgi:chromosome segregation ATPase